MAGDYKAGRGGAAQSTERWLDVKCDRWSAFMLFWCWFDHAPYWDYRTGSVTKICTALG